MSDQGARKCCLVSFLREYRDNNVEVKSYSAVRDGVEVRWARPAQQKVSSGELVGKRYELRKFFARFSEVDCVLSETSRAAKVICDARDN